MTVSDATKPAEKTGKKSAFRAVITGALARMPYGRMTMRLPDRQVLTFGGNVPSPTGHYVACDLDVKDEEFFSRAVLFGHIGFSEAFMDGQVDTTDIASVIAWFLLNLSDCGLLEGTGKKSVFVNSLGAFNQILHLFKFNNKSNSRKNISYHYDLSNDLFQLFLDETMTYSSALFNSGDAADTSGQALKRSLKEAQIAKYENLCRKLQLKESDSILEIGSGWGGFAVYAVEKYGCRYTGLTISKEQLEYAENLVREKGLTDKISFNLIDYRSFQPQDNKRFDKIVSIEMIEAVGHEYYDVYFQKIDSLLGRDGLAAIQMITSPDCRYDLIRANTDFIQKHIFPGSLLPSLARINQATARTELFLHDLEDMGNDYARTLITWQERFDERLPEVRALGFDQIFVRKWRYYLSYCAAAFAMRNITVVQAVYTRPNNLSLSHGFFERFARPKTVGGKGEGAVYWGAGEI